uniref:Uncharacterized protein n=1 Tax=Theileria annulata TaxID=5874 RepID=A0A3B0N513_THEAN
MSCPYPPSISSECDVFEFNQSPSDITGPDFENFLQQILHAIYSPNYVKSATVLYPYQENPCIDSFRENLFNSKDTCFVVSNITLTSLLNLDFIVNYLVPKRLSVLNIYYNYKSKINFIISSKGVLTINLDLEVFRTIGLSNCNITHRNEDESVTLEINLLDTSYLKPHSRLYERLLFSLSKISPSTVIISSEILNSMDLNELRTYLKAGQEVTISPCRTNVEHFRVHLNHKEYSLKFFNENIEKLVEEQNHELNGSCGKRIKTDTDNDDLDHRYEKMESQREILVKIFSTLKKKPLKSKQVIKDMIHELNRKNLNEFSEKKTPIHNIISFIDHINLESLKVGSCNFSNSNDPDQQNAVNNTETYELLKLNNGIISNEYSFNLLKEAWVLLKEVGLVIMSLYYINGKKVGCESLSKGKVLGF